MTLPVAGVNPTVFEVVVVMADCVFFINMKATRARTTTTIRL
jgi:hypothetical protein